VVELLQQPFPIAAARPPTTTIGDPLCTAVIALTPLVIPGRR
jgi:hypothetical protein